MHRPRRSLPGRHTLTSPSNSASDKLKVQVSDNAHCEKDRSFALLRHNTIKASITGIQFLRPDVTLHLSHLTIALTAKRPRGTLTRGRVCTHKRQRSRTVL